MARMANLRLKTRRRGVVCTQMKSASLIFLTVLTSASVSMRAAAAEHSFSFRNPHPASFQVEPAASSAEAAAGRVKWLRAWPTGNTNTFVELGDRVVVQLQDTNDLRRLTAGHELELARVVTSDIFILQAPDAWTAAREAHRLAALPEVQASYPVMRSQVALNGPYAFKPNDLDFGYQYYFENRFADGTPRGVDINLRAAWPYTRGAGVTVAVGDTGFETDHPDLTNAASGAPHYNFEIDSTNGYPPTSSAHGTAVAGFIGAQANNSIGIAGAAPESKLASWVVIGTHGTLVADESLMDAFQYQSNVVQVQNHSWGNPGAQLYGPTLLASIGISNAITFGRGGRGVILTRTANNYRADGGNANDDAYCSDPRVIGVASVRAGGRAASYSNPGACVLVSAVGGDSQDGAWEFTTDRQGLAGYNPVRLFTDPTFWDYAYNFYGTSAAAPQIAGIVALLLSANANLTYRDVQQILILSARHFDFADPVLTTNGAGFLVSDNDGFGVPDAGQAVTLARSWPNRPPVTTVTFTATNPAAIPDDGLRVLVTGSAMPTNLTSIHTAPSTGPQADTPTPAVPLVDFGFGTNVAGFNLTNKAALIQRGINTFADKINNAAAAGVAFAVIYNYPTNAGGGGGDQLWALAGTDFVPIPAVFIGNSDGVALQALFQTNVSALAQIHLNSTNYVFNVTNTLLCEHVGLRVMTDHQLRGDVRITLVSPAGTRSVLQHYNSDTSPGPADWTYYSTHHFYESSAGDWTACFSDEGTNYTGTVQSVSLTIYGVPIHDHDKDGLDDFWEIWYFWNDRLTDQGPKDDQDRDGYSNAREQVMGTDPTVPDNFPFNLDLSPWNQTRARLSWASSPYFTYEVWSGTNVASLNLVTNLPGRFPETEWFTPYDSPPQQFFRVRATPIP